MFGVTVTGRQAAVPGVDKMTGPTMATVPVRIRLDKETTSVDEMLQRVQAQTIEMTQFEQVGLQKIRRISAETERGSQFQTLLVIQRIGQYRDGQHSLLFESENDAWIDSADSTSFEKFNT